MKQEEKFSSSIVLPKEERLEIKTHFKPLKIGIPKESSFQENRVSLTPDAVGLLVNNYYKLNYIINLIIQHNF